MKIQLVEALMKYALKDAPRDYQVWWQQMLDTSFDIDVTTLVLDCTQYEVAAFREEFLENLYAWMEDDLDKVTLMTEAGVLDKCPPLVHMDGFLRDGYHRVAACMWVGRTTFPAINLSDVARQLRAAAVG